MARLDRMERERELIGREDVHQFYAILAAFLRRAGEQFERSGFGDALEILNDCIDNVTSTSVKFFGEGKGQEVGGPDPKYLVTIEEVEA